MKSVFLVFVVFAVWLPATSQQLNRHVREANNLYRQGKFELALPEYRQSVSAGANDPVTNYNLGNALFRTQNFAEAAATFEQTATTGTDDALKQRSYYNQGVSYSRHQKLEESIEAYKKAVIMDPADEDARINLQKALSELKKKQPPEQQKKQEEQKKPKDKQEQKNPQPKSNLTRKQVEQLLKALQQREQQVQQKMQQNRSRTAGQQEKDW